MDLELIVEAKEWTSDKSENYINLECYEVNQEANELLKKLYG